MSLVNDMLRDLDSRESAQAQRKLGGPMAPPVRESRPALLSLLAMIVVVSLAAGIYWLVSGGTSPSENAVKEVPAPDRALPPEKPPTQAPDESAEVTAQPAETLSSEPVATAAPDEAQSAGVERLLKAAKEALAEDRLTRPPVHNAHALYTHILLLEPDNAEAQAGIRQIQVRYRELAQQALELEELDRAERYLERSRRVGSPEQALDSLRSAIKQRRVASIESPAAETEADPEAPEAKESEPAAEPQSARMTLSWRSRQDAAMADADARVRQGDLAGAIAVLEAAVSAAPQAEAAAIRLFNLYLESGKVQQAKALQTSAPSEQLGRYFRAKLMARDGDSEAALGLLNELQPDGALEEPFTALQAALYQREKRFDEALRLYRHLVEMNRYEPNYWLGLGIAAEALRDRRQALQAFLAADQLSPANPAVSHYVKQRIAALSSP